MKNYAVKTQRPNAAGEMHEDWQFFHSEPMAIDLRKQGLNVVEFTDWQLTKYKLTRWARNLLRLS